MQDSRISTLGLMAELLRMHVDCSEEDLKTFGVSREDLLFLARTYEGRVDEHLRDELRLVASDAIAAFRAGKSTT